MQLRKESVPYMGNLLTNEGIKPDPEKVKAIIELQPPSDVKGTRSLLGMANYLMRFLPIYRIFVNQFAHSLTKM